MSQKKVKDKNIENGKKEVPVASRLTYYTPQPTEKNDISKVNESETTEKDTLRQPLHTSLDDVKEVASIIDYSMFFNDKPHDTLTTTDQNNTVKESLASSLDDETREQILKAEVKEDFKNSERETIINSSEKNENGNQESLASSLATESTIRPSLLASMEDSDVSTSTRTNLSEQVLEENSTIGPSLIRPSLLASVEEGDVNLTDIVKASEKMMTQNTEIMREESTIRPSLVRPSLLASEEEKAPNRESTESTENTENTESRESTESTESLKNVRPSLGLLSASKLSKKSAPKAIKLEPKNQTESPSHSVKVENSVTTEKIELKSQEDTEQKASKNIAQNSVKKIGVKTLATKSSGVKSSVTTPTENTKGTVKILKKVSTGVEGPARKEEKDIDNSVNQTSVENQSSQIAKKVQDVSVQASIRPSLMGEEQAKETKEIQEAKEIQKPNIRQSLMDQAGQGVQIEQLVAEQSLAAQSLAAESVLSISTSDNVESNTIKNSEDLERVATPKKSTYTSVLDRLTDDDSSAVSIFGDGTTLADTDKEEKSIFSSAFADEKETDIVKVAFFQKKSKTNLTTADLAALPYFQEDKEFMSKVDEAWYDQGEKSSKNLVLVFSGLLLFFVAWAAFASIDEVARGQGQVVPSQRMQLLQHLEGGILNDILVAEGDTVEPDQILARVDNVSAASSLRDIESQITEANLALIRLEAERQGIEPVFPEKYMILAPEIVAAQEQTFLSRSLQQESSYGIFEQQIEQKHQELNEALSRQRTYENAQALVQKRVDIASPLVPKKLYPEVDFLNLKQELVRLDGDIDAVKNSIAKINAEVREAEGRLNLSKKEFMSEVIKEINTLRGEIATLEQGKTAGTDRVTRTELRSQVRGVVNRILLNTKGGVVKPAETIMEIVPLDDTLVIETKVRPQDIAFIHPNQKAVVRITAYDASIYGTMDGFVEQIGADTVTDEQGEIFFLIKVRTEKSSIFYKGEALPIMPGMIASVDILTGKKTVLSYLLKPITKASQYALKER